MSESMYRVSRRWNKSYSRCATSSLDLTKPTICSKVRSYWYDIVFHKLYCKRLQHMTWTCSGERGTCSYEPYITLILKLANICNTWHRHVVGYLVSWAHLVRSERKGNMLVRTIHNLKPANICNTWHGHVVGYLVSWAHLVRSERKGNMLVRTIHNP